MPAHEYLSYTYLIGWTEHDRWYYGVRWTQKRKIEFDIGIHYFTSSKYVKEMIANYGNPDLIHIDKIFACKKEAREYETKVLKEHKVRNSYWWLNRMEGKSIPPMNGKNNPSHSSNLSEEDKKKMSERVSGENNPMFGKRGKNSPLFGIPKTEEHKQKLSESQVGENHHMFGKTYEELYGEEKTLEIKKKKRISMSGKNNPMYGKIQTPEARRKISNSLKGKNNPMFGKLAYSRKEIIINDIKYNSIEAAAINLGVSRGTIHRWIKKGRAHYFIQKEY